MTKDEQLITILKLRLFLIIIAKGNYILLNDTKKKKIKKHIQ